MNRRKGIARKGTAHNRRKAVFDPRFDPRTAEEREAAKLQQNIDAEFEHLGRVWFIDGIEFVADNIGDAVADWKRYHAILGNPNAEPERVTSGGQPMRRLR